MLRLLSPFLQCLFIVATLRLIIPTGINILNVIASFSSAAGKENISSVFMSDKKKKKPEKSKSYIIASCLTSAPSCGTLAAIPNPKIWFPKMRKIQGII